MWVPEDKHYLAIPQHLSIWLFPMQSLIVQELEDMLAVLAAPGIHLALPPQLWAH